MQLDMFDGSYVPPHQSHSETSRLAAEAIKSSVEHLQSIVLEAIRKCGIDGLTDNEGIALTGIQGSTYRPRRRELEDSGLIVDSKKRRITEGAKRKVPCVVWVAKEFA